MGETSDGSSGTPPGRVTPRKTSATYRPWFNLHAPTEGALRLAWVSTQLTVMKRDPKEILDVVWYVVGKRIDQEISEKLKKPIGFKQLLVDMIEKDKDLVNNVRLFTDTINTADDQTLQEVSRPILLKNHQKQQLRSFIAGMTRKQFILKNDCIKIKKELDAMTREDFRTFLLKKEMIKNDVSFNQYNETQFEQAKNKIFDAWVANRGKELSSASNEDINNRHEKYRKVLSDSIKDDGFSECFPDPSFLKHIVCRMGSEDFKILLKEIDTQAANNTDFNVTFNNRFFQCLSKRNNISKRWWQADLIFMALSICMLSISFTSFSDTRKEKVNLWFEGPFNGLEIHDPIFRGVGFGLFALSVITTWLLHPVDQKALDLANERIKNLS